MDRIFRPGFAGALLLLTLLATSGCSLLATGMWIVHPNDVRAEYPGLKQKRVAVVCRPLQSIQYRDVGGELAQQVGRLLKKNVSKIDVVSQQEITDWLDQKELDNPVELGKAVKAQRVVVLDLAGFSLHQGSTLYQGQAQVDVTVYDVATGEIEYETTLETTYPRNNAVPREGSERQFGRVFLTVLADQISRRFYAYDSRSAMGMDLFYDGQR